MASMEEKKHKVTRKETVFFKSMLQFLQGKKMVFGRSIDEINSHRPIEGGAVREGPKLFWLEGTSECQFLFAVFSCLKLCIWLFLDLQK